MTSDDSHPPIFDELRTVEPDAKVMPTESLQQMFKESTRPWDLVIFPLDGSYNPDDIGRLLLHLQRGNDLVIASRFTVGSGARSAPLSQPRRIGNRLFTLVANLIFGGNLTDSLSQFKALRGEIISSDLHLPSNRVVASYELSLAALRSGFRIAELPTEESRGGPWHHNRTVRAFASIPSLLRVLIANMFRGRGTQK